MKSPSISSIPWRSLLVLILLLIPVPLLIPVAPAQGQDVDPRAIGGIGLTVYTDRHYGGQSATFRQDVPDLRDFRGLNDAISSLAAGPGEFWEVCEDTRYRGRCVVVSETEANLSPVGWSDRISSLRRVRDDDGRSPDDAEIVLYSSRNYGGESLAFDGPVRNLSRQGFNDRARSARITGSWQLCRDTAYRSCETVARSFTSLEPLGLDRRVSSLRPIEGNEGASEAEYRLTLYEGRNYAGGSQTVDSATPFLFTLAGQARSARAVGTWQVCTGTGFSGDCELLTGDVPDLEARGLERRIISARPVRQ